MIICTQPKFDTWMPALAAAGVPALPWTRLLYERVELCNALEWAKWLGNPVQVQLCDACGTIGCGSGGYIHLTKVSDTVLWTRPQIDSATEQFPATALERLGAVGFSAVTWNAIIERSANVPELSLLEIANGHALQDAWSSAVRRFKADPSLAATLRRELLAADTLEADAAIEKIEQWSAWFAERNNVAVDGRVVRIAESNARVEKVYFDGPASGDWEALAEWDGSYYPLLDPSQFFVPNTA
jgi:hypothetical protein